MTRRGGRAAGAVAVVPVLVLVLVGAAGCSGGPVPSGPASPPGAHGEPGPLRRPGVPDAASPPGPPVVAPRDGSAMHGCVASTATLAPDLVSAASASPAGGGCTWTDPSSTAVLRADVRAAGGLGALHRVAGAFRAFRTGDLDGAPTVVTTPPEDPSCSLHVGLSDGEVLTVQVGPATAPVPDPCGAAADAASRLLAAMPPAAAPPTRSAPDPGGPP